MTIDVRAFVDDIKFLISRSLLSVDASNFFQFLKHSCNQNPDGVIYKIKCFLYGQLIVYIGRDAD